MSVEIFRARLLGNIQAALREAQGATAIDHKYLAGRIREIVVRDLFRPILSSDFDLGTGKVVDSRGTQSSEIDLIVYSRKLLPPIMYSDEFGVFPVDSCFAAIEIKTTLTSKELRSSVRKARQLGDLRQLPGTRGPDGRFREEMIADPHRCLFAFQSKAPRKNEFERYKEADPSWNITPAFTTFCVVGKGTWSVAERSPPGHPKPGAKWHYVESTAAHDEVAFFLTTTLNSLGERLNRRGNPYLGPYFIPNLPLKAID